MYQESFSNFFKQFRRTFCFMYNIKQTFLYDEHLGIEIPHLQEDWEEIPEKCNMLFY